MCIDKRFNPLRRFVAGVSVLWLVMLNPLHAQEIPGIWWTPEKDGKLEFFLDSTGALAGRLIAKPTKGAADLDSRNPEARLRSRRVLGAVIFSGFHQEAKNKWVDGKVYDPQSGATYDAKLWLEGDKLMLRGFLGLSLFGRTETMERVTGATPRLRQAGEPELVHLEGG